jgi:hypothetical protein
MSFTIFHSHTLHFTARLASYFRTSHYTVPLINKGYGPSSPVCNHLSSMLTPFLFPKDNICSITLSIQSQAITAWVIDTPCHHHPSSPPPPPHLPHPLPLPPPPQPSTQPERMRRSKDWHGQSLTMRADSIMGNISFVCMW